MEQIVDLCEGVKKIVREGCLEGSPISTRDCVCVCVFA